MHSLRRRLANGVVSWTRSATHPSPASACGTRSLTYCRTVKQPLDDSGGTLASPWSALQRRGAKVLGSDVSWEIEALLGWKDFDHFFCLLVLYVFSMFGQIIT